MAKQAPRIEDFGEYIPGARKENALPWSGKSDFAGDLQEMATFATLWPSVKLDKLVEAEVSPLVIGYYKTLRDIARLRYDDMARNARQRQRWYGNTRNSGEYLEERQHEVTELRDSARELAEAYLTDPNAYVQKKAAIDAAHAQWKVDRYAQLETHFDLIAPRRPLLGAVNICAPEQVAKALAPQAGDEPPRWSIQYHGHDDGSAAGRRRRGTRSRVITLPFQCGYFPSMAGSSSEGPDFDAACADFASRYTDALQVKPPRQRVQRTPEQRRNQIYNKFNATRLDGTPLDRYALLIKYGGIELRASPLFSSYHECHQWLREHKERLIDAYLDLSAQPRLRVGEKDVVRRGPRYRQAPITPEQFMDTFRVRGVQYGNHMTGEEREQSLQHTADALLDLARVLGVAPAEVSLGGDLAIAFGARGRGGRNAALAHYEPGLRVMNLTRLAGAGCLAHEWFHAFDHAMGGGQYWSENTKSEFRRTGELPVGPMSELLQAIDGTEFYRHALQMDLKRKPTYWSTPRELCARAFERYVSDELAGRDLRNDFLVRFGDPRGIEEAPVFRYHDVSGLHNVGLAASPRAYPCEPEERAAIGVGFGAVLAAAGMAPAEPEPLRVVVPPPVEPALPEAPVYRPAPTEQVELAF